MTGRTPLRSGNAGLAGVSYYDLVLAVLPLPLVFGLLADRLLLASRTGLLTGALVSALVVGHVLFGKPPVRGRRGGRDGQNGPRGPTNGRSA